MKGLVIINPSSGKQVVQRVALETVNSLLSRGITEEIHLSYTHGQYDAYRRAASVKPEEYGFIIAVGGDGTVNEVVNGIVDSKSKIPLVIIAAGTTNDFATSLNLPKRASDICNMIEAMNTVMVDVGKINDHYFLNVAAGGLLSEVAHRVSSDLKTSFGKLAYYMEGVKDISSLKLDTVPLRFEFSDGSSIEEDVFLFVVANTRSVGGFAKIAPQAKINDGLLDVCIIKKIEPLDILPTALKIQTGTHITSPKIIYKQTAGVKITSLNESADKFPLDFDGENGGLLPVMIETEPSAISLVVPSESQRLALHLEEELPEEITDEYDDLIETE